MLYSINLTIVSLRLAIDIRYWTWFRCSILCSSVLFTLSSTYTPSMIMFVLFIDSVSVQSFRGLGFPDRICGVVAILLWHRQCVWTIEHDRRYVLGVLPYDGNALVLGSLFRHCCARPSARVHLEVRAPSNYLLLSTIFFKYIHICVYISSLVQKCFSCPPPLSFQPCQLSLHPVLHLV